MNPTSMVATSTFNLKPFYLLLNWSVEVVAIKKYKDTVNNKRRRLLLVAQVSYARLILFIGENCSQ